MRERVLEFIASGEGGEAAFDALALDLFAWQRANNPDYAALCADAAPTRWQEIPAVPVTLLRDLPFTCFPPEEARVLFRTSGTTGRRGVHRLLDAAAYDLGARKHATACLGAIPRRGISLVTDAPDSSLGHMCRDFAPDSRTFFRPDSGLDAAGAWAALRAAAEPVFVPGTAFAFADLLAHEDAPCPLPPGSIVMVTGGFKGRRRRVSDRELQAALRRAFPGAKLVGEYGMTELASQLWAVPLGGAFQAPPWMRILAVDPLTGEPAREGLLRFYDLANHQTMMAVETQDWGVVYPGNRVELRGRLRGAPPRGCSLAVEEAADPPPPPPADVVLPVYTHETVCYYGFSGWPGDEERAQAVVRALARVKELDAGPLSQGLDPAMAQNLLRLATQISVNSLLYALRQEGRRPERLTIVVAAGVFTSPIEWAALYAAAGCKVHLKAPYSAPEMTYALADALAAEGLPVTASTSRDLLDPDVIVAFGDDATMEELAREWPRARLVPYGHRFSVAWFEDEREGALQALAVNIARYDTRGCMAPVALFTRLDPAALGERMAAALAELQRLHPRGPVPPEVGPEWRRRVALARRLGRAWEGEGWAVLVLPPEHFTPAALPRMAVIHPAGPDQVAAALAPWRRHLSTLGMGISSHDPVVSEVRSWFPREAPPGWLQTPPFPRLHDGRDMMASILESE